MADVSFAAAVVGAAAAAVVGAAEAGEVPETTADHSAGAGAAAAKLSAWQTLQLLLL